MWNEQLTAFIFRAKLPKVFGSFKRMVAISPWIWKNMGSPKTLNLIAAPSRPCMAAQALAMFEVVSSLQVLAEKKILNFLKTKGFERTEPLHLFVMENYSAGKRCKMRKPLDALAPSCTPTLKMMVRGKGKPCLAVHGVPSTGFNEDPYLMGTATR
jgi:hypothetical protein